MSSNTAARNRRVGRERPRKGPFVYADRDQTLVRRNVRDESAATASPARRSPGQARAREERVRQRRRSPTTLDDLLSPEVLHGILGSVCEKHREIEQERYAKALLGNPGDTAREEESAERKQHAVHAMVVAVVDGGNRPTPRDVHGNVRDVEPAENGDPVEREAQVGGYPGRREREQRESHTCAKSITLLSGTRMAETCVPGADHRQHEGDHYPGHGEDVDRLHVCVCFRDDTAQEHGRRRNDSGSRQARDDRSAHTRRNESDDQNRR